MLYSWKKKDYFFLFKGYVFVCWPTHPTEMVTSFFPRGLLLYPFSSSSLSHSILLLRRGGVARKFHLYPRNYHHRIRGAMEDGLSSSSAPLLESVTEDFKNQSLVEKKMLELEDLNWENSFVRELPSDPRTDPFPREVSLFVWFIFDPNIICIVMVWINDQVLHACYTKVSPSVQVDDPQLVVYSQSVADLLHLDNKESVTHFHFHSLLLSYHIQNSLFHFRFQRPDFPLFFSGASPLLGA